MLLRRAVLPMTILLLVYGFWISPDFKRLGAGVALFLFGILLLEDGFRAFAGGALERVLRVSTDRLWKSLAFGMIATTLVQSSSLVSLLAISFLSSGLMSLAGGIGVIFGANLGTTTGAWLVAGLGLNISLAVYAMPLLVIGVLLVFQRDPVIKGAGHVLVGIGLLFLGIDYMKLGFESFRTSIDLTRYSVEGFVGLLIFTGIGVMATVVMQSSHAVLVLILTGLSAGQLSYENALALSIGSNVGTTITAIIGSLGANQDGRRLAAAHLVFNGVTAVVAIVFIEQFMLLVNWLGSMLNLASDAMQLALFHTLFNVTGLILMLPLVGRMESFLAAHFRAPATAVSEPKFLNKAVREYPGTAIEAIHNENERLYDVTERIIIHGICLHRDNLFSEQPIGDVVRNARKATREDINERYARNVKVLYSAIVEFASDVTEQANSEQIEILRLQRAAGASLVEAVKSVKHLQKNLLTFMVSNNPVVREQYDLIREMIAQTLRSIHTMRSTESFEDAVLLYDEARYVLARADIISDGTLDRLIRSRSISAPIATSLMNDYAYAHRVCDSLLRATKILFLDSREPIDRTRASIPVNEDEIAVLSQAADIPAASGEPSRRTTE
jgi:phosphate:Na+ symporter